MNYICDSVLKSVKEQSVSMLQSLTPAYKDLKVAYDSTDAEMMNYQIGLRQKELEYFTRRDMKRLVKHAKKEKIALDKLEKIEADFPIQTNDKGYGYSYAHVKCAYRNREFKVHFVLIELNDKWFYGEGLYIEELEVAKEVVPDYDKIDAELEKKRKEREEARKKAEEEKIKAALEEQKRLEKEKKAKEKEEERLRKEKEKEEKAKEKARLKEEKERLKKEKEAAREEKKRLKKEEQERKAKEKEEAKKKKEEERKLKEKQREEEKKRKEKEREEEKKRKAEEREKQKEQEKKEKEKEEEKSP